MDATISAAAPIGVQATAVISGTFLSGMMSSLAVIMVPILFETSPDPERLLPQWACLYKHGHRILPAISVAVLLVYSYVAYNKWTVHDPAWIAYGVAGLLTVGIIPFTLIVMLPTNNLLFSLEAAIRTNPKATTLQETRKLVLRWGRMHLLRSMFPLAGALLGFRSLLKELST